MYYDCLFLYFLFESLWIPVFGWLSIFLGDFAPQARKILRELKHQKRCEEAATTIAAYWHGTQVGQRPPPGRQGFGSNVWNNGSSRTLSFGDKKCFTGLSYWARICLLLFATFWCGAVAHAFAFSVYCLLVTSVFLLSPLKSSSNLSCLKLFCNSFSHASQARRELSRLKEEARNKHAIAVIWAYWLGSKVLYMHISSLHPQICNNQSVVLEYQGMNDYN